MRRCSRRGRPRSASSPSPRRASRRRRSPRLAAEVAELGARVAGSASAAVRGDALTGVMLAEAAAAAAARLVEINVGSGPVFERARNGPNDGRSKARASATGTAIAAAARRRYRARAGQRIRRPISAVS